MQKKLVIPIILLLLQSCVSLTNYEKLNHELIRTQKELVETDYMNKVLLQRTRSSKQSKLIKKYEEEITILKEVISKKGLAPKAINELSNSISQCEIKYSELNNEYLEYKSEVKKIINNIKQGNYY